MFDIHVKGGVYHLKGRLDASQAERAERMLGAMQTSAVADASKLDYISSAGISALVRTQQRLQDMGHRLTLVNLQPGVRSIFHYAHLEKTFGIE
jgi:anti-anti-sigma factor